MRNYSVICDPLTKGLIKELPRFLRQLFLILTGRSLTQAQQHAAGRNRFKHAFFAHMDKFAHLA